MKLKEAATKIEDGINETLIYMDFPDLHWIKLRSNNVIERLNREIRRTRVVGTFPDGNSALMLVCASHGMYFERGLRTKETVDRLGYPTRQNLERWP